MRRIEELLPELPAGLVVQRTAGPFDGDSLPNGLRRDHRIAAGTWGCLRVIEGVAHLSMATDPPIAVRLVAGEQQAIPPGIAHRVRPDSSMLVAIDFLVRPGADQARSGG